jgi:hypothetical protein
VIDLDQKLEPSWRVPTCDDLPIYQAFPRTQGRVTARVHPTREVVFGHAEGLGEIGPTDLEVPRMSEGFVCDPIREQTEPLGQAGWRTRPRCTIGLRTHGSLSLLRLEDALLELL